MDYEFHKSLVSSASTKYVNSQILQNVEMNIVYIGNFEENMDLSRIYLAVRNYRAATNYCF